MDTVYDILKIAAGVALGELILRYLLSVLTVWYYRRRKTAIQDWTTALIQASKRAEEEKNTQP